MPARRTDAGGQDDASGGERVTQLSAQTSALASIVPGAAFRLVKGPTDHGLGHAFAPGPGRWAGGERPESD